MTSATTTENTYDYIVVGGGTAGCVVASRLYQYLPKAKILILERGNDDRDHPLINALPGPALTESHLQVNHQTVPQTHLNGRRIKVSTGNLLSGSSGVNYGAWQRGHKNDYDRWATLAGEGGEIFSYDALLPYFKRVENTTQMGEGWDKEQHGFAGPMKTAAWRDYPMKDVVKRGWEEIGQKYEASYHGGRPVGFADWVENWDEGRRQPAGKSYELGGIQVKTGVVVRRVVIEGDGGEIRATGVETADDMVYSAGKEVLVCCGGLKTPQVLLLSGIGGKEKLASLGVKQLVNCPDVGRLAGPKSREGLGFRSENFNKAEFALGLPFEWICGSTFSKEQLESVLDPKDKYLVEQEKAHAATTVAYLPMGESELPFDGSVITAITFLYQPASTGTVSLRSTDPMVEPIIDPEYLRKEIDRTMIRLAARKAMTLMESSALQEVVEGEIPPQNSKPLTSKSSDEEIDERVRATAQVLHHPSGTVALGKVVDVRLRVKGVQGLRVIDTSVFPSPISCTPQATVYAIAELAAELIAEDN